MTVRMRHTKGHTRNRRAHHSLEEPRLSTCANCGKPHLRHKMCDTCGKYKGRQVVDMDTRVAKKTARVKRKRRAMGLEDKKSGE
ncbi:50S ribosomal protein L32 [Candidatus Campbellbacteria bacterium CG22_combo_CG10-13_8_21_14_all_36_13]|uniref:Large ribosomal subunit protein bL32 n=1 Tax=Candidatus Campbellbacteria bacterium CG22_combo_CG10-13_8_21_14_all_36_13 TaxID=1974529 RepID=A0A2H0DXV3_9BACT|nr:MAG: 50S ribosomal protein L32 [Candidatus Campbellbacteria bacterium CG22_combo_CG10-13_8_21_14_all_36_13]